MGAAGVAACSSPDVTACPAIAWSNALTVQLVGDPSAIADVKLCQDEECAPTDEVNPSTPGPFGVLFAPTQVDGDTWVFALDMATPEQFSVRTYAADGTVLTDTAVAADWVRVGGSEECSGPHEATVTVQL